MFENDTSALNKTNRVNNEYMGLNGLESDFGVSMYERVKSRHKNSTRLVSEDDDDLVSAPKRSRKSLPKRHFLEELNLATQQNDSNDEDSIAENNEIANGNRNNEDEELQNNKANKEHPNEEEDEEVEDVIFYKYIYFVKY